jgi:peptidoglycan hydrolase-like protein with peptidoglycan-binding domain
MPTPSRDADTDTDAVAVAGPPPAALARRRARPLVLAVTGVAVAAAAGFAARGVWPGTAPPAAATATVPVGTAAVIRTDVSARDVVAGTLGYAGSYSVVNELGAGILTWLPGAGTVVRRGQPLFQVAGQPTVLLYGAVPAWRDFGPAMTPGPDVRELQRNLAALGFAPGRADGQFGWSTEAAIERWQRARGLTVTGVIPLGQVAFLPGPLRVTGALAPLGAPVAAGAAVLSGTSATPAVTVALTVGGPAVQPGNPVLVTMPNGAATVPGVVASVGRVATVPSASAAGQGSGTPSAAIPVTIKISMSGIPAGLDQAPVQVTITQQRDSGVLAVPVTALLAQPGGGYAVRASGPEGRLIPVTTGVFDDATGLVEVAGRGLKAGLTVEVAQS